MWLWRNRTIKKICALQYTCNRAADCTRCTRGECHSILYAIHLLVSAQSVWPNGTIWVWKEPERSTLPIFMDYWWVLSAYQQLIALASTRAGSLMPRPHPQGWSLAHGIITWTKIAQYFLTMKQMKILCGQLNCSVKLAGEAAEVPVRLGGGGMEHSWSNDKYFYWVHVLTK